VKLNIPIAFASLLLSLMLWFVVYSQNAPRPDIINAPLSLDGLDDSRTFVRKSPNDIRLVVSAPADRLQAMRDERVTASVDLSQPIPGTHEYPVILSPAWVRNYVDTKPTARLTIEPMTNRVVPVYRMEKGRLRDQDLQLTNKRTSPSQVTVRGPESEVTTVVEARAYLDLSEIDPLNTQPQESEVVPLDRRGNRPQHVRTTPAVVVHFFSIGASPGLKVATVVPDLDVSYDPSVIPNGYEISPKVVNLTGKPVALINVSKVPTERIRLQKLSANRKVRVRLIAPAGTEILGPKTVEVTVKVLPGAKPSTSTTPILPTEPLRNDGKPIEPPPKN